MYGIGESPGPSVQSNVCALGTFAGALYDAVIVTASLLTRVASTRAKIMGACQLYEDASAFAAIDARIAELSGRRWQAELGRDHALRRMIAAATQLSTPSAALWGICSKVKSELLESVRAHGKAVNRIWDRQTYGIVEALATKLERQVTSSPDSAQQLEASASDADWEAALAKAAGGAELRLEVDAEPAREPCFQIVAEAPFAEVGPAEGTATSLHATLMSIEIVTIEVCSRMIVDFYLTVPWDFVLDMARQCWDEAHHAMMCWDRIEQLGFRIGQFPIDLQLWHVSYGQPLEVRLGAHQRLGEWLGTDGASLNARRAYAAGDDITGRIWEYIESDEVAHVGYGNKWVRFVGKNDEGVDAIHRRAAEARRRFGKTVFGPPKLPLSRENCIRAGFTDREIEQLARARGIAS